MGVCGSGKTTVGRLLAGELGWIFRDGDDYHPPANVAKMAAGVPLTDADRQPWLRRLAKILRRALAAGEGMVLACSALRAAYRQLLGADRPGVLLVYLRGSPQTIAGRLAMRRHRYMPASLLDSQFAVLEEPGDAMVVDVEWPPAEIVRRIRAAVADGWMSPASGGGTPQPMSAPGSRRAGGPAPASRPAAAARRAAAARGRQDP